MPRPEFDRLLGILAKHRVDFIVVGGVGAVLQGAYLSTFDLDIVHSTEPANVARLLAALRELDACYRMQPERLLRPGETHLASPGHQLLMTRFGPLDVLGSIGKGRRYENLLPRAVGMTICGAVRIQVLDLETQIAVKEEIGQEKDLAALPLLRRTLEELRRKGGAK
jgi:hypothetical protein